MLVKKIPNEIWNAMQLLIDTIRKYSSNTLYNIDIFTAPGHKGSSTTKSDKQKQTVNWQCLLNFLSVRLGAYLGMDAYSSGAGYHCNDLISKL